MINEAVLEERRARAMESYHEKNEYLKAKWPEWYERRIERGEPRKKWNLSRAVYDYWLKRLREEIEVGNRYFAIMTLAIFAKKCSGYDTKKNPHPVTEDKLRCLKHSLLLKENKNEQKVVRVGEERSNL